MLLIRKRMRKIFSNNLFFCNQKRLKIEVMFSNYKIYVFNLGSTHIK